MTVGSPPSTTATTEFVVPRSMPITFAMLSVSSQVVCIPLGRVPGRQGRAQPFPRPTQGELQNVDLDPLGLDLFRLAQCDREHPVAIGRLHLVGLHRDGQRQMALEPPVPALPPVEILLSVCPVQRPPALRRKAPASDR